MKQSKLRKYREIAAFPNVIEAPVTGGEKPELSRTWDSKLFEKKQEITLELGCGWGEYTLSLAERFPERNFIGIDIKGARIWKGAEYALRMKMPNVLFLRIEAEQLGEFFPEESISEIWITFPDPHMKKSSKNIRKRFTSGSFLRIYRKLLKKEGVVHLKTDSEGYYRFTKISVLNNSGKITCEIEDLYSGNYRDDILVNIQTRFEKRFLKSLKTIKYLRFTP